MSSTYPYKQLIREAKRMAQEPVVRRRLAREFRALVGYENQASVMFHYHRCIKTPTQKNRDALSRAVKIERDYEKTIGDVLINSVKGHRVWRTIYVQKALDQVAPVQ